MKIKLPLLFLVFLSLFYKAAEADENRDLPPCSLTLTMSSTPYYCTSSYEGSATVTASGGVAPYTYSWTPVAGTTSTISGLMAGTYTVWVTDSAGCNATDSVVVATATVSATATASSIIAGDSTLLTATYGAPASYAWSPAAYVTNPNSQNTYAHPPVTTVFTVTVSTYCGTISTTVTVTVTGCTFTDHITKTAYFCPAAEGTITASPSGGTPPYTYSWSPTGQTTQTITGLSAGAYDLTIEDAAGCYLTNAVSVSSASISFTIRANPSTIIVGNNTFLTLDTKIPATYSWSPSASVTNPTSDSTYAHPTVSTWYVVTITTHCGTFLDSVYVNVVCFNYYMSSTPSACNTGTAAISAYGGVSPYTYSWSPGGGTTSTISGLSVGTYTVTASDAAGCSVTGSVGVSSQSVSFTISGNPLYILAGDSSLLSASCSAPATFSWYPPLTVRNPNSASTYALPTVTTDYTVTITTACQTFIDSVLISINCFNLGSYATPAYCSSADASAWVTPSGGVPPYTYSWSPGGETTDTATGLNAGTYYASVTDSNGCSATIPIKIVETSAPPPIITSAIPKAIALGDSSYLTAFCYFVHATYVWSPTTGLTNPYSQNTYAHPTVTTVYTVSALTACGTAIGYDTVVVINCINNYNEPLCIVTIDTGTNKCDIIWGRTNSPPSGGSGYFKLYKDSVSGHELTHSQPLNVLSDYIDMASNPASGPVSYELSTVDSCGESSLSSPHTTIYLTVTTTTGANHLNWTPYIGFTPSEYRIFRGLSMTTLVQIDSLPTTVLSYRDTLPPAGSIYLVEAVNPAGICVPTTHRPIKPSTPFLSGSFSNGANMAVLGVQSVENSTLNLIVSPNPSNGQFTLNYRMKEAGNVKISVVNQLGQVEYHSEKYAGGGMNTEQLNLTHSPSGLYTLGIQTDNYSSFRKLVIINNP